MKKTVVLFLILVYSILLLIGCNDENINNLTIEFLFDHKEQYTGFSYLPSNYTLEEAENDGYFVTEGLEAIANIDVWEKFIKTSEEGINTSIRIVKFYTEDVKSHYFIDLFYEDGYYYLFDSSSENQEKQPFSYLLTLEGKFGNPLRKSGIILLTNDASLTFDMIMRAMTSSNMSYIKNISPYKIVMFR